MIGRSVLIITGTIKHDYWDETVTIEGAGTSDSQTEYWKNFWMRGTFTGLYLQTTFTHSLTRVTKRERVTFIPPGTTVSVDRYRICESEFKDIPPNQFSNKEISGPIPTHMSVVRKYKNHSYREDSLAYLPKTVSISLAEFSQATSPLSFRSFVTYSTDEKFTTEAYVDNLFYVARVTQIPFSIFEARKVDPISIDDTRSFWAAPSSFYVYKRYFN